MSKGYLSHPAPANTTYQGVATIVEADVTSATGGGYKHELRKMLHHAQLIYVGNFRDGVPVRTPRGGYDASYDAEPHLPFVTGGTLKLVMNH